MIRLQTALFVLLLLVSSVCLAQVETVRQWNFDKDGNPGHWNSPNHLRDVTIKDGIYRAVSNGTDPFISASDFEAVATTPSQAVEIRYRTNSKGTGQLFFTNTAEGLYGGFSPKKCVSWNTIGDEQWHTARIMPGWNDEKKIVKLRIDFPDLSGGEEGKVFYEVDWIRVVDMNFKTAPIVKPDWDFSKNNADWQPTDEGGFESPPMRLDVDENGTWISLEMAVKQGKTGTIRFYSDQGKQGEFTFPLKADGKSRWYNLDALNSGQWRGNIHLVEVIPSDEPNAKAKIKRILVSESPQGPAEISIEQVYQTEAINRTGKPSTLAVRLRNDGGETAKNIKISPKELPAGMKVVKETAPFDIDPTEIKTVTLELSSEKPIDGVIQLTTPVGLVDARIRIEKNLGLPKADYVPKPEPVESDYEIGALYFPGWATRDRWDKIENTHPERKPVLGWYDEANPEVIDWQIKWSLENGIQHYFVDWYWHKGHQYLDHWVKGFYKARYKSMFKWAMMWANHNAAGSHSEEDQRAVTKFWIENYFNTPEYLTKDGRPVVIIWSPENMDRDIADIERAKGNELKKGEGVKRLLDLSQAMAKEAGLKGIYFISMKWPEASTRPENVQWLADAGFEMTSIYHFMHHGDKAKNPKRFDFQLVVDASLPYMEARHETGILPFLPNLSTGWDSRPWHGDKQTIIDNRTVEHFRTICQDYKKFAERTGVKSMTLAPTNEWGEGSYAEPNVEHGFGMFETIRDTFCKKPQNGWPLNYGPSDVGLGPYDLPPTVVVRRTEWDFKDGTQDWRGFMGISDFKAENGVLSFKTTNSDPAMNTTLKNVKADDFDRLVLRMKVYGTGPAQDIAQLFWSTATSPISETNSTSIRVEADGEFHDYVFELKPKKPWRRNITSLRLDPVNSGDRKVEIQSIRLEK